MRENRQHGSEGGAVNARPYPYQERHDWTLPPAVDRVKLAAEPVEAERSQREVVNARLVNHVDGPGP